MAIRITQAGVALTVGIIILTGLIVGGFFLVKNSGEQARRDEATKIAQQNLEEQSRDEVALESEDSQAPPKEESPTGEEATSTPPADTSATETEAEAAQQPAAEQLPQTGPAEQLSNVMALTLLTFSVASYVNSRRQI